MALRLLQASGISIDLTIGSERPACTMSSNTASSAAESELPAWISGERSARWSPKASWAMRGS